MKTVKEKAIKIYHDLDGGGYQNILSVIIKALEEQDRDSRQKVAEEVKALQIGDITTTRTIYNAILEGGK